MSYRNLKLVATVFTIITTMASAAYYLSQLYRLWVWG